MTSLVPFKDLLINIVDNRGKTCPVDQQGMPLIATNCVKNATLYPTFEKIRHVSEETYANWFRGHPRPGDMIFVTKGSPGQVCLTPDPVNFCIAQDMVAIRANEELVYPKYLFAALRSVSVRNDIANMHVGTLIPHFKKGDFDKLKIPVPSRDQQVFIGDVYFELSRKIDLNRRMNETLEAMARALFKDWFVNYGPVRAKAEGRQPPGLSPEIAALFPDALDDDDKPVGWRVDMLLDVAALNPESWSNREPPKSVEYVDLANTKWGTIESTQNFDWIKAPSRARRIVRPGDTIVGTVRPGNGSYSFVGENGLTASTGFAVLRPKNAELREIVYLAATSHENIERLSHLADGAAYPAVRPDVVAATEVVIPGQATLRAFCAITAPLINLLEANKRENRTLAQTRDLLLPKLMSGEILLREAEKAVEAVA